MKKYLISISILIVLCCSNELISGVNPKDSISPNSSQDSVWHGQFIGTFGSTAATLKEYFGSHPFMQATGEWHFNSDIYFGNTIYVGNCLNVVQDIQATNYKSSDGSPGKTVTEEYEDKQGNLHTKVYKNGLLISLKINGVEQ